MDLTSNRQNNVSLMKLYRAPWCLALIIVSWTLTAICLGIAFSCWFGAKHAGPLADCIGLMMVALVVGCALFAIRGYTITPDAILVHRLVWTTRLPRAGLQSARVDPKAIRWSLRAFGNGGFFSASGIYWNRSLGFFRAFITDPRRAVVLRFAHRTVVVSPETPEDFARELASTQGGG
jgi:hypothetical protein